MIDEIKVIRFATDEVICKVLELDTDIGSVTIFKPFIVIAAPSGQGDGQVYIRLIPFATANNEKETFDINLGTVVTVYDPAQALVDLYAKMTSTIVQPPEKTLIV